MNQKLAVRILENAGHVVVTANDGAEAIDKLSHHHFDLVIMDCQMPDIDGYEATRRIRQREASAGSDRVPIVALTAHALEGEREKFLESGMDDCLTKPIIRDALNAMLTRYSR